MPIHEALLREIDARFSPEDARDARLDLEWAYADDGPGTWIAGPYNVYRVQIAILLFMKRDLRRFREALLMATSDPRDVLGLTGLHTEHWRENIRAKAYEIPED